MGCASASKLPDQLPSNDEVKRLIENCERAVLAHDWRTLRSCFLPTAKILYHEPGDPRWQEMLLDEWIQELESLSKVLGYHRSRGVVAIEPDPVDGLVVVRSNFREGFLQPGGRRVFEMAELMIIIEGEGGPLIASIAYYIIREKLEPISPGSGLGIGRGHEFG